MRKKAVCFLLVTEILVTQIGEFISAPPHSSYLSKERRRRADGGVGFWPRGNEQCGCRRSGFGTPNGRILLFASKPRSVCSSASVRSGIRYPVVSGWSATLPLLLSNGRVAGIRSEHYFRSASAQMPSALSASQPRALPGLRETPSLLATYHLLELIALFPVLILILDGKAVEPDRRHLCALVQD